MEDDFSIFHTGNFLPFHTKNLPFHTKIFFHIPFHASISQTFRQAMQQIFCALAMLKATIRKTASNNTKMQRLVSGIHMV